MEVTEQHRVSRGVLLLALVCMAPSVTFGQADAPAPEDRFAGNIASAREMATNLKDEYTRMADELPQEDVIVEDLKKAKEYYDGIIANFEDAAKAWAAGDEAGAQKAQEAGQAGLKLKDVWRRRMFEFRRAQKDTAPTEAWITDTSAIVREGAAPAFTNLVESKKAASGAWRDVAEASLPGATPETIDELRETAFAATAEVDIALWQFHWANQLEGLWADKTVTKEDVEAAMAALVSRQNELVALRRKQVEHERNVRLAHREIGKAQEELYKAVGAAREAKARDAAAAAAAGDPAGK